MDTDQKIEVMKAAVQLSIAVLADRSGLAQKVSGARFADEPVTPLVERLYHHLCGLIAHEPHGPAENGGQ